MEIQVGESKIVPVEMLQVKMILGQNDFKLVWVVLLFVLGLW